MRESPVNVQVLPAVQSIHPYQLTIAHFCRMKLRDLRQPVDYDTNELLLQLLLAVLEFNLRHCCHTKSGVISNGSCSDNSSNKRRAS